jgi:hypothetical protein
MPCTPSSPCPGVPRGCHSNAADRHGDQALLRPLRPILVGDGQRGGFETRAECRARAVSCVVVRKECPNRFAVLFETDGFEVVQDCEDEIRGGFALHSNVERRIFAGQRKRASVLTEHVFDAIEQIALVLRLVAAARARLELLCRQHLAQLLEDLALFA